MQETDFAIITPLPVEWHAVRAHLTDLEDVSSTFPTAVGRIGHYRVVLRMPPDTGEASAADITRQVVTEWNPAWVVLVGVAGGFTDQGVGLGDVVVASKIYAYDVGKIHMAKSERLGSFERRDKFDVDVDRSWYSHAKVLADPSASKKGDWNKRIKGRRPDGTRRRKSRLHTGPIASGDKVVDNPDYQFFAEAKSTLPELYAIEMEGSGVGVSVRNLQAERQVGFFMIRGISDLPRHGGAHDQVQGRAERDSWKPYAAAAAAAFLEHLLSQPGSPRSRNAQPGGDGLVPNSPRPYGDSFHSPSRPVASSAPQFDGLTGGLENLPGAVLTKVEGFLAEYLGPPESPAPFGGRTDELTALDQWLVDPSKPYALLVAPTGRGKSALVSRWADAVAAGGRAHVAFLPVNLRFDTARPEIAFAILGGRLRHMLSTNDEARYPDAAYWLTEIDAYLRDVRPRREPLLVVIDGADEAIGWSLGLDLAIPPLAAPGLKVLVSARSLPEDIGETWRTRLNWSQHQAQTIELPALDRAAVRQLVLNGGIPIADPADAERFASEVYRLTAGDPILVQLYVQLCIDRAQSGRPLTIDELQTIEPGMAGYFRREWDGLVRQWAADDPRQEPVAHALLYVLSCARGQLSKGDLIALTKHQDGSGLRVERALTSLKRLVIGNAASGYVFGHPRYGQFFREELFAADEVRDWETRIMDYGRGIVARLNAGALPPANVPQYVLQHHGSHLVGAGASPSEVFALITNPWLLAWEGHSGTYDGFLDDLHRAWALAEELGTAAITQNPPRLIESNEALRMQIRAALLASSIRGLAGSIPFDLLRQLVEVGRWAPLQGIAYAGAMPSDPQRKAALCELADLEVPLPSSSTLEAVRRIRDRRTRVEALACVMLRLDADWADPVASDAIALVEEIGDLGDRAAALEAVVPVLPEPLIPQGTLLGASIPSGYDRIKFLVALAERKRGAARARLVKEALAETATCDDGLRVLALQSLALVLTPSTQPVALALAAEIESPLERARALLMLLPRLSRAARRDVIGRIEQTMDNIELDDRIDLRIALLDWVDNADLPSMLDRLDEEAQEATAPGAHQHATSVLAQFLVANNRVDDALAFVDYSFDRPAQRAGVLLDLVGVAHAGDLPQLVETCRAAIAESDDPAREALSLAELAAVAPEPMKQTLGESAAAAARRQPTGRSRAEQLATVAQVLPRKERGAVLDEALATARGVGTEWHSHSATVLCQCLDLAGVDQRPVVLDLVLAVLPRIEGLVDRAYVLSLLLPYAEDGELRHRLSDEALDALVGATRQRPVLGGGNPIGSSFELSDWERYRADVLLALLPFLNNRQLHKALDFARSVGYASVEVGMLIAIGRHLDPEHRRAVLDEARSRVPRIEAERSRADLYGLLHAAVDPEHRGDLAATIAEFSDPHARAIGYASLLVHNPAGRHPELTALAQEAAAAIHRPQDRYSMSLYLGTLVPEGERLSLYRQAAAAAGEIPGEWERMVRLGEVANHLNEEEKIRCLEAAAEAARALRPINGRWQAMAFLVCRLMELGRADLAAALVPEIEDERVRAQASVCVSARAGERFEVDEAIQVAEAINRPEHRAELLVTVAEHAPPARRRDCLERALGATLAVPRDRDRAPLLNAVAPLLAGLSAADRYAVWSGTLRTMGEGDRPRLLTDLTTMLPEFTRVGGQQTILAIAEAVAETDTWFSELP